MKETPYATSGISPNAFRELQAMAPKRHNWNTRLTRAAYEKGFAAGADHDVSDPTFPDCPYDARYLPNFARGSNDPKQAWRDGSLDGQRLRRMMTNPTNLVPPLMWREAKLLPATLRALAER